MQGIQHRETNTKTPLGNFQETHLESSTFSWDVCGPLTLVNSYPFTASNQLSANLLPVFTQGAAARFPESLNGLASCEPTFQTTLHFAPRVLITPAINHAASVLP